MDLFKDCEIQRMHLRGSPVVLIVGDRAVSADEGAELLAQYAASFGRSTAVPAYVSSDGWQLLKGAERRAAVAATTAVAGETKPAESASNTPETATQVSESASQPAAPASQPRPVIHAQHKKGGR
jgi:hypothetical protein